MAVIFQNTLYNLLPTNTSYKASYPPLYSHNLNVDFKNDQARHIFHSISPDILRAFLAVVLHLLFCVGPLVFIFEPNQFWGAVSSSFFAHNASRKSRPVGRQVDFHLRYQRKRSPKFDRRALFAFNFKAVGNQSATRINYNEFDDNHDNYGGVLGKYFNHFFRGNYNKHSLIGTNHMPKFISSIF